MYLIMKPFLLFQKFIPRFRRKSRAPRSLPGPAQDTMQVVPVWVGSQLSGYPVVVAKRARPSAKFYDEWE